MQEDIQPRLSASGGSQLWQDLIRACRAADLHRPALLRNLAALLICYGLWAGILLLAWQVTGTGALFACCAGLSLIMARFAFIGHDAGHGAAAPGKSLNNVFGSLSMTTVCGLAFQEWRDRHRAHHQYCQSEERDPDMKIDVVASLTSRSHAAKSPLARRLCRYQHYYVWPLTLLFGHNQRHGSHAGVIRRPLFYRLDLLFLLLHGFLWLILPLLLQVDPLRVILVYLLPGTLLGPHMAAIFWVNHIGMPLADRTKNLSWVEQQVVSSRTIRNPAWLDWFFGGLNFQIEHHIYPAVPSTRLRRMQAVVRPVIEAAGLPYENPRWTTSVRQVGSHFRAIGRTGAGTG